MSPTLERKKPNVCERIKNEIDYFRRYRVLRDTYPKNINFPSYFDFDKKTLPYRNDEGSLVYEKALSLKRSYGEKIWNRSTARLTNEERQDFQIVMIPSRHEHDGDLDFSKSFQQNLEENALGGHPVATFKRGMAYHNDPHEGERLIENMVNAKSVYIVASPLDEQDFDEIRFTANQYLNNGALEVNLIAPFMANERDDKNIEKLKDGDGEPTYNGRILKIQSEMRSLGSVINRIVTFEPHSSATHAFAALSEIALAPLSMEEELVGQIKNQIIKDGSDQWVVVRPDEGRNIVATRIEERFRLEGVHINQLRDSTDLEKNAEELTEKETEKIKGKNTILYDDEGGSLKTVKNVVIEHLINSDAKSINIFLAHVRLQEGDKEKSNHWEDNLTDMISSAQSHDPPIKINVYATDSRVPVGKLKEFMANNPGVIEVISVVDKTRKAIEAMVKGVNFWKDKNGTDWEAAVLQTIKKRGDKKEVEDYD